MSGGNHGACHQTGEKGKMDLKKKDPSRNIKIRDLVLVAEVKGFSSENKWLDLFESELEYRESNYKGRGNTISVFPW